MRRSCEVRLERGRERERGGGVRRGVERERAGGGVTLRALIPYMPV